MRKALILFCFVLSYLILCYFIFVESVSGEGERERESEAAPRPAQSKVWGFMLWS